MLGQTDEVQAWQLICHAVSLQDTTLLVGDWKACQNLQVRPETRGENQRVGLLGRSIWPEDAIGQHLLEHRFALESFGIQSLPVLHHFVSQRVALGIAGKPGSAEYSAGENSCRLS